MTSLTGRKWYTAAVILAIGAIAAQLLGKYEADLGKTTMGAASRPFPTPGGMPTSGWRAAPRTETPEWQRLELAASQHAHRAELWGGAGAALVSLAAICWAFSSLRGEPGGRGVVPALLAIYLLLLLLVV